MASPLLLLITLTGALVESIQCKTFHILTGVPLERLPGHVAAQGRQPEANDIDISLVDLKIKVSRTFAMNSSYTSSKSCNCVIFCMAMLYSHVSSTYLLAGHTSQSPPRTFQCPLFCLLSNTDHHNFYSPSTSHLRAAPLQGPAGPDGTPLVSFTTKAYKSNGKDRARPFGPTLRVRRGSSFSITLTNDLVAGPGENATAGMPNHLS